MKIGLTWTKFLSESSNFIRIEIHEIKRHKVQNYGTSFISFRELQKINIVTYFDSNGPQSVIPSFQNNQSKVSFTVELRKNVHM